MADYQESQIAGKKWRRCAAIEISNPPAPSTPLVTFRESDVVLIDGKYNTLGTDTISAAYDPAAVIELVDPETLEPLGKTVSEQEIYLCLFSKYIAAAKARDARVIQGLQDAAAAAQMASEAAAQRLAAAQAAVDAAQAAEAAAEAAARASQLAAFPPTPETTPT